MVNQTLKGEEDRWVEGRIESLAPPAGWTPDTDYAFEKMIRSKESAANATRRRLTMAGAVLMASGLILFLLPWNALWKPRAQESSKPAVAESPSKAVEPEPIVKVAPQETHTPTSPAETSVRPQQVPARNHRESLIQPEKQENPLSGAAKVEPPAPTPPQPGPQETPQPQERQTVRWSNSKEYEDFMMVYNERDFARKAALAEQFFVGHKDADPETLTQVYKMMLLAYANSRNWTKTLETFDRISLAPRLTDQERMQFAEIALVARQEVRRQQENPR